MTVYACNIILMSLKAICINDYGSFVGLLETGDRQLENFHPEKFSSKRLSSRYAYLLFVCFCFLLFFQLNLSSVSYKFSVILRH